MRKRVVTLAAGMIFMATSVWAAESTESSVPVEKGSYAIGMDIANSLKRNEVTVDPDVVSKAIKDVFTGQKTDLTDEEAKTILATMQKEMQAKSQERMKAQAEKNKQESEAYLAENKKKEGVRTLPSGLQYKILTEGTGQSPTADDTVTVHYTGSLVDGTVFDSSHKRGEAATFPVSGVIKGWTEALQIMKEGDKWQIVIPSELAYGETGGGPIGPNAALIFEVELLSVQDKE